MKQKYRLELVTNLQIEDEALLSRCVDFSIENWKTEINYKLLIWKEGRQIAVEKKKKVNTMKIHDRVARVLHGPAMKVGLVCV